MVLVRHILLVSIFNSACVTVGGFCIITNPEVRFKLRTYGSEVMFNHLSQKSMLNKLKLVVTPIKRDATTTYSPTEKPCPHGSQA